ncbi:vWA domain-containing protein [Deinococcus saxicola]
MGGGSPGETHLRLAVDISASMSSGGRMTQARRMAFTVVHAAQMAGVAVLAVAFDERVQSLVEPSAHPQNALNAVAAVDVRGDTCLSPALRALWTPELSGQSVTLIITDGQLSAGDYAACGALKAAHSGAVVPILLGSDAARPAYERAFGVCVHMDDPAQLTNHVIAFLRAWQARLRR